MRNDIEDQPDIDVSDVLRDSGGRLRGALQPGDPLAHDHLGLAVVDRHDLRSAQHLQPPRLLQGADQDIHRIASRRQHEAAELRRGRNPTESKVRQSLRGDRRAARVRRVGQRVHRASVVKVEADVVAGHGTAVIQQRVLQAEFDAHFIQIVQLDFRQQHLDHDHRWSIVQLLDHFDDLVVERRRGADDQRVGLGFGLQEEFAFQLLERRDRLVEELILVDDLALLLQQLGDRVGHVLSKRVFEPVNRQAAAGHVPFVQPQQQCLDHFQIAGRTGHDDAVGAGVDSETQRHEHAVARIRSAHRPAEVADVSESGRSESAAAKRAAGALSDRHLLTEQAL